MLTPEETKYLIEYCVTRPLSGLNLLQAQKLLGILEKLQKSIDETQGVK